jgi:hypothetical protein
MRSCQAQNLVELQMFATGYLAKKNNDSPLEPGGSTNNQMKFDGPNVDRSPNVILVKSEVCRQ